MSIFGRLHLDDIISSLPELGPTVPNDGYSWIILIGIMIIQMTVPSVISMYGVVLGNIVLNEQKQDFYILNEKIILTPILLAAFWNLADPWTTKIVKLASVPRLVALIGIILLSVGLLASGYLATGGVGAYFASLSAGIVMGIGTSLVMAQCEQILNDHFRTKFLLVTTLKNVAFAVGFVLSPIYTFTIFQQNSLQTSLLMMAIIFLPSAVATLILKSVVRKKSSPYTLLLGDDDNELLSKEDSYQINSQDPRNYNIPSESTSNYPSVLVDQQESIAFAYDDDDNTDVDVFIKPVQETISTNTWRDEVKFFRSPKSWVGISALVGIKSAEVFLWILFPPLAIIRRYPSAALYNAVVVSVTAGCGCLISVIISHWSSHSILYQNMIFGCSVFANGLVFLAFSHQEDFAWMAMLALAGGVCVGCLTVNQQNALHYMFNSKRNGIRRQIIISTIIGVVILFYFSTSDALICLKIVSGIQIISGICFLATIMITLIAAKNMKRSYLNK